MTSLVRLRIAEVENLPTEYSVGHPPIYLFLRDEDTFDKDVRVDDLGAIGVCPEVVVPHPTTQLVFDRVRNVGPLDHTSDYTLDVAGHPMFCPSMMASQALDAAGDPTTSRALGINLLADHRPGRRG